VRVQALEDEECMGLLVAVLEQLEQQWCMGQVDRQWQLEQLDRQWCTGNLRPSLRPRG
jgi:hypothetical protein